MEPEIALIGVGYWGKNLLRNLYELKAIKIVVESNIDLLTKIKSQYRDLSYCSDYKQILTDPSIKAVVIATPAITHYKIAKESLLAGKDVFVEKPLAINLEEAKELKILAEENSRILMVGHILRYHPAIKKLKEMIGKGEIGKIYYVYSNRLNIGKLRTEENILWSFAPHDISVIIHLLEELPVSVSCFGESYITPGIYDTTLTSLEFSKGIKAHVFVSWLHPFKEQKLVVIGSKGMLVFDDMSKEKLFLYKHKIEYKEGKLPVAQKAPYIIVDIENKEPLKEELKHFIECIHNRSQPITNGEEGINVLKILAMAEESLKNKGKKIIKKDNTLTYYIHPTACVDENVKIGEDTKIWHYTHILSNTIIGKKCILGQNVMVGPDVVIGDKCKIQNNVSVYKGVKLEEEVFIGPSAVFTNVINPRAFIERKNEFQPTLVKKGVTIGANATIICGITLGEYSFVGAGAVVTHDVKPYALMVGVPARQVGWVCKCGCRLNKKENKYLICKCGNIYIEENSGLIPYHEK